MKYKRIKLRLATSVVFSLLLTLLIFVLLLNIGIGFGVFNNNAVIRTLNKTSYYEKIYSDIHMKVQELLKSADMPAELFDDVINKRRVHVALNNYVNNTLLGEVAFLGTDKLVSELNDCIENYYDTLKTEHIDEIKTIARELIYNIELVYNNSIQNPTIYIILDIREQFTKVLIYLYPILIILIAVIGFCLIKLYRHKHRALRYINYAMLAASLLLIIFSTGYLVKGNYEWLNGLPDYYCDFFSSYSRFSIQASLYTGFMALILSAALISLTTYVKKRYYTSRN